MKRTDKKTDTKKIASICGLSALSLLVCNRQKTSLQPWYRREMEAIRLMEKTGQTYLDKSFCIFTKNHIESLKKLPARENVAC